MITAKDFIEYCAEGYDIISPVSPAELKHRINQFIFDQGEYASERDYYDTAYFLYEKLLGDSWWIRLNEHDVLIHLPEEILSRAYHDHS